MNRNIVEDVKELVLQGCRVDEDDEKSKKDNVEADIGPYIGVSSLSAPPSSEVVTAAAASKAHRSCYDHQLSLNWRKSA